MVTRKNLADIVRRLMENIDSAEGAYRDALIDKIIFMCSRDKYEYLEDFAWYISVLIKLAYIQVRWLAVVACLPTAVCVTCHAAQGSKFSNTIAAQLYDVCVRVEEVREFAVQNLLPLITGSAFASGNRGDKDPILAAAAWIVGEYASFLPPQVREQVIDALLQPAVLNVSALVQSIYMECVLKILSVIATAEIDAGARRDEGTGCRCIATSSLRAASHSPRVCVRLCYRLQRAPCCASRPRWPQG